MTKTKTPKRTAKTLADLFEPTIISKNGKGNLHCASEDEAVLLAHELKKRGWKAKVGSGITDLMTTPRVVDLVILSGRQRGAPPLAGAAPAVKKPAKRKAAKR